MDENPYLPPPDTHEAPRTSSRVRAPAVELAWMLGAPILAGDMAGHFTGPLVGISPTDPRGNSIATGLGGFAGLALYWFTRWVRWLRRSPNHR